MGKKKQSKQTPDSLKDLGNKAFASGSFQLAIDLYTEAISLQESHIYYGNRANAHLQIGNFRLAISDCDEAIRIKPSYVKSYVRKGNALFNLQKSKEAKEMFEKAYEMELNDEIKDLIEECYQDQYYDQMVPQDHPMRLKFNKL